MPRFAEAATAFPVETAPGRPSQNAPLCDRPFAAAWDFATILAMFEKNQGQVDPAQARRDGEPGSPGHPRREGAGRDRPSATVEPVTYAALDLGTNNCRLLVARASALGACPSVGADGSAEPAARPVNGSGFEVIDAFSRIVRLGEGLERCGTLSKPAMDRTIDALRVCAAKIRRRRVVHARHVATEACRRAINCGEFLDRVRWETGLRFEIISCAEEAALALAGCATLLDPSRPHAVVFDIGGGSTELMWARRSDFGSAPGSGNTEMLDSISLPFGVINLSETFGGDCVAPEDFERMVNAVRGPMEAFEARHGIRAQIAAGSVQMLGTSGTVTTLAGIRLDLPCYDRSKVDGSYLDFTEVREVTDRLLTLDCKGRAEQPCIGPSRADLVLAGCAILEAICRTWPVGRLRVADRGVREGILHNLMRQAAMAVVPAGR